MYGMDLTPFPSSIVLDEIITHDLPIVSRDRTFALTFKLLTSFQIDLRDDAATIEKLAKNKQKPLSLEMGEKLAKELRAVKYVECSALTQVLDSK